ncbi:hypothetical protein [Ileibacterium valens]|uniref:Uncharacterized protein n=1 Tax=Ileibacterium valens TaxID=1862668 RepID=A0A1U7NGC2_9FIRM|nr:hypothetical protein [Ileibacterium valens]OLU37190.1 hypothetical protein BM735_11010 [Erysipelotrichaceae bacterium NYU-BL-F16]OLU40058.1 hypothetical protein BO222_05735 [Ileibacterium valens]OLU40376.1 hypothetical protein BO224_05685 [Erysipelotrichaceae bacterium NYU-BL-E8]
MEKSVKIMLFISAVFLAIFVIVLYMDYSGFHSNIEQIIKSLRSDEPYKLQAAWYSVVMIRIFEFLVLAIIFGAGGLFMHIRDNRIPKAGRR